MRMTFLKGRTTYGDGTPCPVDRLDGEPGGQEFLDDGNICWHMIIRNHGGEASATRKGHGQQELIRQAAADADGHATLFRSAGKSVPVFSALKPPLDRIHRELKKQFDPAGIFNPGRLYADW